MVADRGYSLIFNYKIDQRNISFNMLLISEKYIIKSNFWHPVSSGIDYTCNDYCKDWGYVSGSCVQNPFGQCGIKGGIYKSEGDYLCTGGPNADTCCCCPCSGPSCDCD